MNMLEVLRKIRGKYTYRLLMLFMPLAVLAYLYEPDSVQGKSILIAKFIILAFLYLAYSDCLKPIMHIMLWVTIGFIGIATIKHGGAGTSLLIVTMFFAFLVFPNMEISPLKLRKVFMLLALGGVIVILYGMIKNYYDGLPAFSWRGVFNPNVFGMILLSVYMYFESAYHLAEKKTYSWIEFVLGLFTIYLMIVTSCRSVLLCMLVFVFLSLINRKNKRLSLIYYSLVITSILFCIITYVVEQWMNASIITDNIEILGKKIFSGREKTWTAIIQGFIQSPLLGQSNHYLTDLTGLSSAHNVFMGILNAGGIIPSLFYIWLLLYQKDFLTTKTVDAECLPTSKLCFMATLVVATFECAYTDNRLNILFLPLLIGTKFQKGGNDKLQVRGESPLLSSNIIQDKNNCIDKDNRMLAWSSIMIALLVLSIQLLEPIALSATHMNLPQIVNKAYLKDIGYGDVDINVLKESKYQSKNTRGVVWEWNGEAYDVIGTADEYSYVDMFTSTSSIPEWVHPGSQYHVIYEAECVRFSIYCYYPDGSYVIQVGTTTSIDFTIPQGISGLIIRLSVEKGKTARETVMPVIYAVENEPQEMAAKRNRFTSEWDFDANELFDTPKVDAINIGTYPSWTSGGIVWEWNGKAYYVRGTAEAYSYVNLYESMDKLPGEMHKGACYQVEFESANISFKIYGCYPDNRTELLVDTSTKSTFYMPNDVSGLIVRMVVGQGARVEEIVIPMIYEAIENLKDDSRIHE